jgi:cytochrome c oxidase assembly factor CtaG
MFEAHVHRQPWSLPLVATSALVLMALIYLRGWLRLRGASPILFPCWRLAAFMVGLFSVWIAVGSPLATLDRRSLTIHMVKHLLLMTVAAPLILTSAPVLPLLRGISRRFSHSDVVIDGLQARWLEHHLPHPVFCWLAGTAAVTGWHLPAAFQLAMRSHWAHGIEEACFLLAGLLFWRPVVQILTNVARSPRWSVPLYLFLATLPCDILSAFLAFCNRVVYRSYLSTTQLFSLSPLEDQQCAGALMWVWVTFAYLIPAVVITMQMLSPSSTHSPKEVEASWHGLAAGSLSASEAEVR